MEPFEPIILLGNLVHWPTWVMILNSDRDGTAISTQHTKVWIRSETKDEAYKCENCGTSLAGECHALAISGKESRDTSEFKHVIPKQKGESGALSASPFA